MVSLKTLGAGAVALTALLGGSAQAATTGTMTVLEGSCGGNSVTSVSLTGLPLQCPTRAARLDVGAIDVLTSGIKTLTTPQKKFFSLGVNGYLLLEFAGTDILGINGLSYIAETTDQRNNYLEYVDIYAGNDLTTLYSNINLVAGLDNQDPTVADYEEDVESFDLGLEAVKYLLLVDHSVMGGGRDGFDVAALQVNWVSENVDVPLPAAGLMLGSAVLGFGALRRRKQKAA